MSLSGGVGGIIYVNDASLEFTSPTEGIVFADGTNMNSKADAAQNLDNVLDNGASSSVTMDLTNTDTSLTTGGDVSIGSIDPEDTRLHVTGNAFITQDLYIDNALAANVVLNVAGGINAANFFGDGGLLTNVTAPQTLQEVVDVGNVSTEVVSLVNNTLALTAGGPVAIGSSDPSGTSLHVTGNIHATNAVVATHLYGEGSNITNLANATQNQILFAGQDGLANGVVGLGMTLGTTPGTDANTLVMSGDITTTNLRVTNNLQVTGTVTQIHTDNLTVTDPIVALNEDYTGDVTTGFVFNREQDGTTSNVMIAVCGVVEESGALDEHLVLARTINAADSDTLAPSGDLEVNVFGNITVSRNIVGEWIHGDGSNLTGLVSDLQSVVDSGNVMASNTIIFETQGTPSLVSNGHIVVGQTLTADTGSANLYVKGNVFVSNALETNAIHMTHADLTGIVIKTSSTISPSVAIGRDNDPGVQSVAIGDRAGATGNAAVAVGGLAGQVSQGGGAVAMGQNAGNATQGVGAIAVGSSAGRTTQGASTVAVGAEAGRIVQNTQSVAVGYAAGKSNQNSQSVAIGNQAGESGQNVASVAIGYMAGHERQNASAIAIGYEAGMCQQNTFAVAVGRQAGESTQNAYAISVGYLAGQEFQNAGAVSVGYQAGRSGQGSASIALGQTAGMNYQNVYSVAIGSGAGRDNQNNSAVAIGFEAGKTSQEFATVSIGRGAGNHKQNAASVAIGYLAGEKHQAKEAVHIGFEAGQSNSNLASGGTARGQVAIGYRAGKTSQGKAAVAIGKLAGELEQAAHSIVINASGAGLDGTSENAFYVSSMRLDETNVSPMMAWNVASNEVVTILGVNADASTASLELAGNLYASNLYGNGSGLTGLVSDLQSVVDNGNVMASNTIIFETQGTPSLVSNGHIVVGQTLTADTGSANLYVKGNAFVSNAVQTNAIHMTHTDAPGVVILSKATPSIAIGVGNSPGAQSVAIGDRAGASAANTVAVGALAGQTDQDTKSVAIGASAGNLSQQSDSVAVGSSAGHSNQEPDAVAVGAEAGRVDQGRGAVAVGYGAGKGVTNPQGSHSIAIGYLAGKETIHEKTIILNASGAIMNSGSAEALYVNPIRNIESANVNQLLSYNVQSNEVVTVTGVNVSASTATLELAGNLYASNLYGNGSGLTGLATTLQSVTEFGATTDQTVTFENTTTALVTDAGTFTALGGGDGSGTTLHVTGNAHTTGAATFAAGFVKLSDYTGHPAAEGGHIDLFARGGTDTAPHSSNGWSMDVVDDANNFRIYKTVNVNGTLTHDAARIKIFDDKLAVENDAGADKVSNLLVSGNVTTNTIFFGSGGSVTSSTGLDLNNVVSRGAVTETGIIIETDHSTNSLTAQVVASNILTANTFTVGGDHIIQAYTDPLNPNTDRALLIGYGGNTDRVGLGEAQSGHATFGVYDEGDHNVPNAVIVEQAKLGVGTGFTNGIPNTLTEALEVVGNIKLSGDLEATNGKLLVNSSGTQGGEIRLYDHSSGAGYWILDNGPSDADGETDFRLWRTGSSRAAFRSSYFNDASEDDYATRIGASAIPVTTLSVTQTKSQPNATDSAGVGEYALSLESTEGATNAQMGLCFTLYTSGTPGVTSTPGAAITHERVDSFSEGKLHFKTKGTNGATDSCVTRMTIDENGTVGVGVSSTVARLDVGTGTSTHYLPNSARIGVYDYFNNESLEETQDHFGIRAQTDNVLNGATWAAHQASIFTLDGSNTGLFGIHSVDNIVTQGSLISSAGAMISSDSRIKKDIVDISDTEALDMVRNLAPKKYRYTDPVVDARSNANVIGFIAQEVANVIPGSTRVRVDKIPNIMAMALVTESNVITFDGVEEPFDTSTLLATTNILVFKSIQGKDVPANIVEVLGTHSIRVDRDLTPFMGSIDENGVPIKDEDGNYVGDGIFVYGQMVNDFHILKKEVVFATGIAALQEVDRQQVADKAKIATLESQVADLLTRLQALENA